jgi:hypothetical protein
MRKIIEGKIMGPMFWNREDAKTQSPRDAFVFRHRGTDYRVGKLHAPCGGLELLEFEVSLLTSAATNEE